MAITTTTCSSAIAALDTSITVASATGFAAGNLIKVDLELMQVAKNYVSGTTIPVQRGLEATINAPHAITSNVVTGLASDFGGAAPAVEDVYPFVRSRQITSINAAGAIGFGVPGNDQVVIINGTVARALTLAVPTTDKDGDVLTIISNGKAAHTVTVAGGLGAAGAGYTVATFIVGSQQALQLMACNAVWVPLPGAMSGTLTNLLVALA
jgi:hypothetical protein